MRRPVWLLCLVVLSGACGASIVGPGEPPVIQAIAPATAATGDVVTITGTGFSTTSNAVRIGAGYLPSLASSDGRSLRFSLPTTLSPCPPDAQVCVAMVVLLTPGTYKLVVTNDGGTSNEAALQVIAR